MEKNQICLPNVNVNDGFDDDDFSSVSQENDETKKMSPYTPVAAHLKQNLDLSFKQAKQALMIATLPQQENIEIQTKMKIQACKEGYNINDPKKVIKEITEFNTIAQDAVEFLVTAENWEDIESLEAAEKAMEEAVVTFDDHQLVAANE